MTKNPLDVLDRHETGMRWAGQSNKGLTLSPKACRNLAAELQQVRDDAGALVQAIKLVRELDANPWTNSAAVAEAKDNALARLDAALRRFERAQ